MSQTITVYSKPGCGQCMFTKKFLERNGLVYQEKDIQLDESARQEVQAMGYSSLPVVVINGEDSFTGYQADKLQALVG